MDNETKLDDLDVTNADDVIGAGCGEEELRATVGRRVADPVDRVDAISDKAGAKARKALGFDRPQA